MKFGYLQDAQEKNSMLVSLAEKNSNSPRIIEETTCQLTELARNERGSAGAVSNRLRLNLG
jgi:hypothetical protein